MKNIGITLCIGFISLIMISINMFLYYFIYNQLFFGFLSPFIHTILLVLFIILTWYLIQAVIERILEIRKGENHDLSKY